MLDWAEFYSVPLAVAANVTAALSPQCEWKRNLIVADEVLSGRDVASVTHGPLPANVVKACAIRDARILEVSSVFKSAPKVESFAANLAGEYHYAVTIDAHAIEATWADASLTESSRRATWPQYLLYATYYAEAARMAREVPAFFQAVVWVVWKRENPPASKRAIRRAKE